MNTLFFIGVWHGKRMYFGQEAIGRLLSGEYDFLLEKWAVGSLWPQKYSENPILFELEHSVDDSLEDTYKWVKYRKNVMMTEKQIEELMHQDKFKQMCCGSLFENLDYLKSIPNWKEIYDA